MQAHPFEVWNTDEATPAPADAAAAPCLHLESGAILFFPVIPVPLAEDDRAFLLAQRQSRRAYHKNVAYRPAEDRLSGADAATPADAERLRAILRSFSREAVAFVSGFLAPYAAHLRADFASFRPVEEEGRPMRLRARNDLLHVDSFPTRPTRGGRILRFFVNINPDRPRVWRTGDGFEALAAAFRDRMPPFRPDGGIAGRALAALGLARPAYDRWMLDFHNFLKENAAFQQDCRKTRWSFPPGSAWMVFTDAVSHAVLSGRFALEQTFIVDLAGMVAPERAPLAVLRRLYGTA
ncbi:MAG: Kdo hydroxylase family protein [Rhodospirillaceae bacterium]|nr:Kdo hydroxylase family protein [Rhodospirillaceae bacterium]